MTKVKVKALQSFAHGNVQAHFGETVTMNKGDADELRKLGFVEDGEAEEAAVQEQVQPAPQEHQQGDVVTDNPETGEPDVKAAPEVDNKMAEATENKSTRKAKAK